MRSPRLAGGHDQQLRDLQLEWIRQKQDQHLADEVRVQRDVVVGADAEAQALFLPPRERVILVVRQRAGELFVR